jgi:hypothetical protein
MQRKFNLIEAGKYLAGDSAPNENTVTPSHLQLALQARRRGCQVCPVRFLYEYRNGRLELVSSLSPSSVLPKYYFDKGVPRRKQYLSARNSPNRGPSPLG